MKMMPCGYMVDMNGFNFCSTDPWLALLTMVAHGAMPTQRQAAFSREAKELEQTHGELEKERSARLKEGIAMASLEKEAAALRLEEKRLKVEAGGRYWGGGVGVCGGEGGL